MKDAVLIKSFPNGITLLMREDASMEEILQELTVKFTEARNFFGSSTMALSMEGRKMTEAEEILILDTIRVNSNVRIACIVGHDDDTNKNFIKALQHMDKKLSGTEGGQFYKGTLKNREVIETENSIVVLGDVYPGSAVFSAGNIIILGGLYGEAYAGGDGREDAYTWTEPYIDNSQVFVVASASGVQNKEELAGKVVAVQKDSSALAALNDEENADNIALRDSFSQLIEYADYNTAFMDLEQGAVDAVAIDIGVAQYQIAQREEGKFVMLQGEDNKLAVEQYAVGFLKGNDELRDTVQKTLDEMAADGTFAQIAEKWGLTDSVCLGK